MPVAEVVFAISKSGLVRRDDEHSYMSLQALLLNKPQVWTTKPSRQHSFFNLCVHYRLHHSACWRAAVLHTAMHHLFADPAGILSHYFSTAELPELQGALLADQGVYFRELHALCWKAFENCWGRPKHGSLRLLGEAQIMSLQSKLLQLSVILVPGSGTVLTNELQRPLYVHKVVQNNTLTVDSVSYMLDGWDNFGRVVGAHSLANVHIGSMVLPCTWRSRSNVPEEAGYQLPMLGPSLRYHLKGLASKRRYVLVGGLHDESVKLELCAQDKTLQGHPLLLHSGTAESAVLSQAFSQETLSEQPRSEELLGVVNSFQNKLGYTIKNFARYDEPIDENDLRQHINELVAHLLEEQVWSDEYMAEYQQRDSADPLFAKRFFQFGKMLRVVSSQVCTVARVQLLAEPHQILQINRMLLQPYTKDNNPHNLQVFHNHKSLCLAPRDIPQLTYMVATPAYGQITLQRRCVVPTCCIMDAYMQRDDAYKEEKVEFYIPGVLRVLQGAERLAFVCLPNPESTAHWANTWTEDMYNERYLSHPDLVPH